MSNACLCGALMSPRARRCIKCFRKERLQKRRAVRRGNVARVLVGLLLGLVLTQANGVMRRLPGHETDWVPVLTTYGAEGPSANAGIVLAVPGVVCVGYEFVGTTGAFAQLRDDC